MKHSKWIAVGAALIATFGLLAFSPSESQAHDYRRGTADGHVLRLIAYVLHPIGVALEFAVTRPVHYLVSQPDMDILLGHKARPGDTFFEWTHGDGAPGIKELELEEASKRWAAQSEPAPIE